VKAALYTSHQVSVTYRAPHERGRLDPENTWSTLSKQDLATGTSTALHGDPDGNVWAPLEVNTTLYEHFWFWAKKKERKRKTVDELVYVYYQSAGQGAVMLLNSTPTTEGLIPETDMELYRALGDEIDRRFGAPVAETSGRGNSVELDLGHTTLVNHVVIMEDYWFGERIREFEVEGWTARQGWKKLATGTHVGRKHITWFDDVAVSKIRLRVTQSTVEPLIRNLAAYHVDNFRIQPGEPLRSAWRQCGQWTRDDFDQGKAVLNLDLTPYITEAGQYQVRFQTTDDSDIRFQDEVLLQAGQASAPGMLRRVDDEKNAFSISRTAVVTERADIRLHLTVVSEASDGIVLIRRQ